MSVGKTPMWPMRCFNCNLTLCQVWRIRLWETLRSQVPPLPDHEVMDRMRLDPTCLECRVIVMQTRDSTLTNPRPKRKTTDAMPSFDPQWQKRQPQAKKQKY